MDARDWGTLGELMTDDVVAEFGTGEMSGRDTVIAFIQSFLDNCGTTQHILGNVIIDVDGDKASSEAYVADMHLSKLPNNQDTFRTLGNYSDSWVKQGDTWLIKKRLKDNRATIGTMDVFAKPH